ncbi:MAG: hypothetical protein ABTQ25_07695 [Nitrosomonas ureae]
MKASAVGIIFVIFSVKAAFAGLLGPNNFEECVLEKMKGQAPGLMGMARAACLIAFPPEMIIDSTRIKYTWCKSEYQSVAVCIEQMPTNVTITRVEGLFFEDACDAKHQSKAGVTAIAENPWYGTTYKFDLPAAKRGCAYFTFYGIERK